MTKLNELINELCASAGSAPEVEYRTLGEVTELVTQRVSSNLLKPLNYVGVENLLQDKKGVVWIEKNTLEANVICYQQNDVLIGNIRPYLRKIWLSDRKGGTNADVLTIRIKAEFQEILSAKFLYYCLSSENFFLYDIKCSKGAKMPRGSKESVMNFKIPVPPLPVQEEIVRILDKFTSLEAELEAELTARRKQYEYYRDALLTPPFGSAGSPIGADISTGSPAEKTGSTTLTDRDDNQIRLLSGAEASEGTMETKVEFFKLKDLCKSIKDGMHNLPKSSLEYGEYPILSAQNIYNNQIDYNAKRFVDSDIFKQENKRTNIEVGDVLLTIVATIGRSAVVKENKKVLLQRSVCALKPNEKVLPGYLKYSLDKSDIQNYMIKNAHGSAQAGLYLNQVEEIAIPLPPLSVQQRIVNVLDNFDAICSDLKIGLPAEIDVRKKQYEYYRDLLLTFAERGNTIFTEQNRTEQNRTEQNRTEQMK